MPKVNYNKLYLLFEPDYEDLKSRHLEFAQPEIRFGYAYGGSHTGGWNVTGRLVFQTTVNPEPGEHDADHRAYAGKLECDIQSVRAASKIVLAAGAKVESLAPMERDEFKAMLIGLRALGYQQVHFARGTSEIVSTT